VLALVEKQLRRYRGDRAAAEELAKAGEAPAPADVDPAVLAAWTSAARALLATSEAITRP